MSKFKVGDKVRIVGDTSNSNNDVGDVGVVSEIEDGPKGVWFRVYVDGTDDGGNWSYSRDIELVSSTPPDTYTTILEAIAGPEAVEMARKISEALK